MMWGWAAFVKTAACTESNPAYAVVAIPTTIKPHSRHSLGLYENVSVLAAAAGSAAAEELIYQSMSGTGR